MSQNEVASAAGIERSHYSRIEMGKTCASAAVAKRIADFFGKPITRDQILYPEDYVDALTRKFVRSVEQFQEAN